MRVPTFLKVADPARTIALAIMLAGLSALFFWWGWRQGAYFGAVFFPGAAIIYLLLIVLLMFAPFNGRLRDVSLTALAALFLLAAWMLISLLWTPTRGSAVDYAEHAFLYAAFFMAGLWLCDLLSRNMTLALAPVALAGIAIGVATTITIGTGTDVGAYLHGDGTLRFPMGYRNANAAFFLIFLWPLVTLASDRDRPWLLRAIMIGGATALVELAVLAQSRGSVLAAAIAAVVWIAFSPARLRTAAHLALVLLPAAFAVPTLLHVFQNGEANAAAVPLLHDSARAVGLTSLASVILAIFGFGWLEPRTRLAPRTQRRFGLVLTTAVILIGGSATAVFLSEHGGPVNFADQRISEFTHGGIPNLSDQGARFGVNVGSNRDDFWRVSLDQAQAAPILGQGAGSFQLAYLKHRQSPESPRDPHSVEMLMLGELGLPGLCLLGAFVVGSTVGALRSRRLGFAPALLSSGAMAALAYWTVHASYDWFWNYPALTAPIAYLAGVAIAPGVVALPGRLSSGARIAIGVLLAAVALTSLPLYLSNRYTDRALGEWQDNTPNAYQDLERAASLNPFDLEPLLLKGVIASKVGDRAVALAAFRKAEEREPDNYAPHYFIARSLLVKNPAAARRELTRARQLNPKGPEIATLSRELKASGRDGRERSPTSG